MKNDILNHNKTLKDYRGNSKYDLMLKENPHLEGLGGVLIIVAIGLILSPIKFSYFLFTVYQELFTNGAWAMLTDINSGLYQPGLKSFLVFEIVFNLLLLLVSIYLLYLFFTKKTYFPKIYIVTSFFSLALILIDAYVASIVFPSENIFDQDTSKEVALAISRIVIWVPYMLLSKRIKVTFRH